MPKKRSDPPSADAFASFFTERFSISGEESADLPDLPDNEVDCVLKTFRVKKIILNPCYFLEKI